jgi:asparaginyl-tRNA synthetase
MTLSIIGTSDELQSFRALKLYAVASKASISITKKITTSDEIIKLSPLATNNIAITFPDGKTSFGGSSSYLMNTTASLAPASGLMGCSDVESALVGAWVSYGASSIEILVNSLQQASSSSSKNGKSLEDIKASIQKDFAYALSVINCHVMYSTYMVGNNVTIADIGLSCALYEAAKAKLWDPNTDDIKLVNISRWYNTIIHQDFFTAALSMLSSSSSSSSASSSSSTSPCDGVLLNGAAPPVQNRLYKRNRIRIKEILSNPSSFIDTTVTVAGWVRTLRKAGGKLLFIELNDGSTGTSLQCTLEEGSTDGFEDAKKNSGGTGSSFQIVGTVVSSPSSGQAVELKATVSKLLGAVYGGDKEGKTVGGMFYPMSKKEHTLEHMREHAHLRSRAGLHAAAMRIRHAMAYATHKFFHDHGFLYIHTPIITCADCEGAGEQFGATTLLGTDHLKTDVKLPYHEAPKEVPQAEEEKKPMSKSEQKRLAKLAAKNKNKPDDSVVEKHVETKVIGAVDYGQDFFGKRANLTVSGQLNVETHACALSDVYTFGPTFRAENSHTSRHLAEFWMIEPEIAFADLNDDINLAEDYLKYCVQYALEMCANDLEFFENSQFGEKGLRDRLRNVLDNPFKRLTYTEAIEILKQAHTSGEVKFEVTPEWGIDLPSEHERYLCEKVFKKPVVLTNYPKDIKAFYMKLDEDGRTVSAADILVPKIGEIIGGSQREHRTEVLVQRCIEMGLDPKHVWWYVDLRKYGTVPHAGFGLGFERLILFITGLDNIRDVIPFPRWAGNAEF